MWPTTWLVLALAAAFLGAPPARPEGLGLDVLSTTVGNHSLPILPAIGSLDESDPFQRYASPCEDRVNPAVFYFVGREAETNVSVLYVGLKNATHLISAEATPLNFTASDGQVACGHRTLAVTFRSVAEETPVVHFCVLGLSANASLTGAARALTANISCTEHEAVVTSRLVLVPGPLNTEVRNQYMIITEDLASSFHILRTVTASPFSENTLSYDVHAIDPDYAHLLSTDGETISAVQPALCFSSDGRYMGMGGRVLEGPAVGSAIIVRRYWAHEPNAPFVYMDKLWLGSEGDLVGVADMPMDCAFTTQKGHNQSYLARTWVSVRNFDESIVERATFRFENKMMDSGFEFVSEPHTAAGDSEGDPITANNLFKLCYPSLTGRTSLCVSRANASISLLLVSDMTTTHAHPSGVSGFEPVRYVLPDEALMTDEEAVPAIMPLADGGAFIISDHGYARVYTNDRAPQAVSFSAVPDFDAHTITLTVDLTGSAGVLDQPGLAAACRHIVRDGHPYQETYPSTDDTLPVPALEEVPLVNGTRAATQSVVLNMSLSQAGWHDCAFHFVDPEYPFSMEPIAGAQAVGVPYLDWAEDEDGGYVLAGTSHVRGGTLLDAAELVPGEGDADRTRIFVFAGSPGTMISTWKKPLLRRYTLDDSTFEPTWVATDNFTWVEDVAGPGYDVVFNADRNIFVAIGSTGLVIIGPDSETGAYNVSLNETTFEVPFGLDASPSPVPVPIADSILANPNWTTYIYGMPRDSGPSRGRLTSAAIWYDNDDITVELTDDSYYSFSFLNGSARVDPAPIPNETPPATDFPRQWWASAFVFGAPTNLVFACAIFDAPFVLCGFTSKTEAYPYSSTPPHDVDYTYGVWEKLALSEQPLAIISPLAGGHLHLLTPTRLLVLVPRKKQDSWTEEVLGTIAVVQELAAPAACADPDAHAGLVYASNMASLLVWCGGTVTRYAHQSTYGNLQEDPEANRVFNETLAEGETEVQILDVAAFSVSSSREHFFVLARSANGTDRLHKLTHDYATEEPMWPSPPNPENDAVIYGGTIVNLTFFLPEAPSALRFVWAPNHETDGEHEYIDLEVPDAAGEVIINVSVFDPVTTRPLLSNGTGSFRIETKDAVHLEEGGPENDWAATTWMNLTLITRCIDPNHDPAANCTRCTWRFNTTVSGATNCQTCVAGLFTGIGLDLSENCRQNASECGAERCNGGGTCVGSALVLEISGNPTCLCEGEEEEDFAYFGHRCNETATQCGNNRCNGMGVCTGKSTGCNCTEDGVTGTRCNTCPEGRVLTDEEPESDEDPPYSCANCDAGLYGADCTEEAPVCVGANLTGCDTCTNLTGEAHSVSTDEPVDCSCYTAFNTTGNECTSLCGDFEGAEPDPDDPRVCLCPEGRVHSALPEHRTLQCAKACVQGTFNALTDECECFAGFSGELCTPTRAERIGDNAPSGFVVGVAVFGALAAAMVIAVPMWNYCSGGGSGGQERY